MAPVTALAQDHGGPPPGSGSSGGDHGNHGEGDPHGSGDPHGGGNPHGGAAPHGGWGPHGGFTHGWGYRGRSYAVVIDRGRPGWWRGTPAFVGYYGPRPGFYFAPGYGYYAIPAGYAAMPWVVGAVLPPPMLRYPVPQPVVYGLAPPPPGAGWYYAGANFVLVTRSTGVIVQSVAGGW